MGQFVPLNHCESEFASRFVWCKPDKIAKPVARKLKPKRFVPTNPLMRHTYSNGFSVKTMDAEYRRMFGMDRGGQLEAREKRYCRGVLSVEHNVVD